ncbi:class III signal peptide-containing protein [Methanocaldococcus fervens]|uniref:class III signal peptide-containing protein n=1 Tax=Methanocaldococcus fervens TaxID=83171 RepID=UPI00064FB930|nr:class III signal peptide-containing protein [Methanocaldococcus fervens]
MISIKSNRGQISLEFSLLVMVVVLSAIIVSYYLISTAIETKESSVEIINKSSNTAENILSKVS